MYALSQGIGAGGMRRLAACRCGGQQAGEAASKPCPRTFLDRAEDARGQQPFPDSHNRRPGGRKSI